MALIFSADSFEESKSMTCECEIVCSNSINAKDQYKFITTSTGDTICSSLVYTTQIEKTHR